MRSSLLSFAVALPTAAAQLAPADGQKTSTGFVSLAVDMVAAKNSAAGLAKRQLDIGLGQDHPHKVPMITVRSESGKKAQLILATGSWFVWVDPECGTSDDYKFCCASGRYLPERPAYLDELVDDADNNKTKNENENENENDGSLPKAPQGNASSSLPNGSDATDGSPDTSSDAPSDEISDDWPKDVSYAFSGVINFGQGVASLSPFETNLTIGSVTIKNQILGVPNFSYFMSTGMFGLGPFFNASYPSPPRIHPIDNLVAQNIIQSRAFSLYIAKDGPGALTFGGVDVDKFSGSLVKNPIQPADRAAGREYQSYWIQMDGISYQSPGGGKQNLYNKAISVSLNSATSMCLLPKEAVDGILKLMPGSTPHTEKEILGEDGIDRDFRCSSGAEFKPEALGANTLPDRTLELNSTMVDCKHLERTDTLDFRFGNATIRVPLRDFIQKEKDSRCRLLVGQLSVGGLEHKPPIALLGLPFLRNAYTVFDQDNNEVWLAEANDCGTNITAIGKGPNAVGPIEGNCCADENPGNGPGKNEVGGEDYTKNKI